jgi:hypothetical protein
MPNAKNKSANFIKSIAWLIETAARAIAGYMVYANFTGVFPTIVAAYFIITAATLLVMHFVRAYK